MILKFIEMIILNLFQTIHDNHYSYIIQFYKLKNGIVIVYVNNGIIIF